MPITAPNAATSTHDETRNAATIYAYSHSSASSLHNAFMAVWTARGAARGATTDSEQDLLRAMLVMACAGLDATIKQLIKDGLLSLANRHSGVQKEFKKFLIRKIKGGDEASVSPGGAAFLASMIAAPNSQVQAISEYVYDLTGESLQSHEQVLKAAAALGIAQNALEINPQTLKDVFAIRNKVIHELDIDLAGARRRRNIRREEDMLEFTDEILRISRSFVGAVDALL